MGRRVIPAQWLGPARIDRVVCHWTGGAYPVSELDRRHYHVILQDDQALGRGEDVTPVRGIFTPAHNDNCLDGSYAAHTRMLNTKSFGLAVACMGEPRNARGNDQVRPGGPYGRWPFTRLLMERQAQAAAEVCHAYHLEVTERTVLQHGEVQAIYDQPQAGKWDCCEWPFDRSVSSSEVGDTFRRKVTWYLGQLRADR